EAGNRTRLPEFGVGIYERLQHISIYIFNSHREVAQALRYPVRSLPETHCSDESLGSEIEPGFNRAGNHLSFHEHGIARPDRGRSIKLPVDYVGIGTMSALSDQGAESRAVGAKCQVVRGIQDRERALAAKNLQLGNVESEP